MDYREEEMARLKRQRTRQAIVLAMQSRWEEAVIANKEIIEVFPTDVDAYNRLGKALMELGNYDEAEKAYSRALELDPHNSIARRNLAQLSYLKRTQLLRKGGDQKATPDIFIEETGKTGVVSLYHLPPREVLARMAAGDQVYLRVRGRSLLVENAQGEYLGLVDPKIGSRLARLIEGGNQYVAAIASLSGNEVRVIIREVFQHPSQAGRLSFPPKVTEVFRPYTRDSLLRYELEDEEEYAEEAEYPSDWGDGGTLAEEVPYYR